MRFDDTPLFGLLNQTLDYLGQRQRVIAQNVANADTPGFKARDIPEDAFARALRASRPSSARAMAHTHGAHMSGASRSSQTYKAQSIPDSETTADGNSVVLEEQMVKAAETRMRYEAVIGLYQKALTLARLAARPPGRG